MSPNAFGKFGTYFSLVFFPICENFQTQIKFFKKKRCETLKQKGKKKKKTISSFFF
jgi:hypothetical protein